MMRSMLAAMVVVASASQAQVFTMLDQPPPQVGVAGPRPLTGHVVGIDLDGLRVELDSVPRADLGRSLSAYAPIIELPAPAGGLVPCFVVESPVMDPALAAKYPQLRTYLAQACDGSAAGRFEVMPKGVTAMLRSTDGRAWMIDPWQSADPMHAVSYWLDELPGGGDWECHTEGAAEPTGQSPEPSYEPRTLQTLRTYRLAMACTGEYGAYQCQIQGHAPNTVDPLAAVVTVVARANAVYEADFAIHFNLVANNDRLMYTDGTTDPYSSTCGGNGGTDCSGTLLGENINTLRSIIGVGNFDIGHILTRIYGGVAYLRAVCTSYKAGGVSGIPRGGDIDPLTALVVIHEMGHQFGANHTFSGTRGRCQGNVNLSTAWEAGSGSSPMAYPGGCPVGDAAPTDNVRLFADPFFHHGSYGEVQDFLLNGGGTACAVTQPLANSLPEIMSTTADTSIPPSTPFTLDVRATDADGDSLTYSWEQYDSGTARPLVGTEAVDDGTGALFRAFPPVTQASRVFPRMADVLSGVATPGEKLPTTTNATRHFRAIVRDNRPGGGGVAVSPLVSLLIPAGTSAFAVTAPAPGSRFQDGDRVQVSWTTGGTEAPPISCANVEISLSLGDGASFRSCGVFPNTGQASFILPGDMLSSSARLRIQPVGGIFFAVSREFAVHGLCIADVNADGGVDGSDVQAFFLFWQAGDNRGDLNGDGGVDGGDVETFFILWGEGC